MLSLLFRMFDAAIALLVTLWDGKHVYVGERFPDLDRALNEEGAVGNATS
jgi:hypothetical protein